MRRSDRFGRFGWGVIGIVLTVAVTYAVFTKLSILSSSYTVKAVFTTAASEIQPGSPVRIAGVNVGKVTSVGRGPGTTALATMSIEPQGLPLHTDATMKIRPRLFLEGNFFVDVQPGSPSAPILPEGGTIPLSQTTTPVQIDQLLNVFTADPRTGMQELIKGLGVALQQGGAQALARTFRAFEPAAIPLAQTAQAAQGMRPDDLRAFITKAADVAGVIAVRSANLGGLLSGFNRTMTAFANQQTALRATFTGLDQTLRTAGPTLTALDTTLGPLRDFAVSVRPALAVAPRILDDASPLLSATSRLLSPPVAPKLLSELGPAVGSLNGLERTLPSLLSLVTPVSKCVQNGVVPVLDKPVDDGKLSTGQPVWQELVRYPVGLVSSAQNFSGNGYGVRYSFGLSEQLFGTNLINPDNLALLGSSPLVGARPAYVPGAQPPMAPNADCQTQPLTSLAATNIPAPAPDHTIKASFAPGWTLGTLTSKVSAALSALTRRGSGR